MGTATVTATATPLSTTDLPNSCAGMIFHTQEYNGHCNSLSTTTHPNSCAGMIFHTQEYDCTAHPLSLPPSSLNGCAGTIFRTREYYGHCNSLSTTTHLNSCAGMICTVPPHSTTELPQWLHGYDFSYPRV